MSVYPNPATWSATVFVIAGTACRDESPSAESQSAKRSEGHDHSDRDDALCMGTSVAAADAL